MTPTWAEIVMSMVGASFHQTRYSEGEYISEDEKGVRASVSVEGTWTVLLGDGTLVERKAFYDHKIDSAETRAHGLRRSVWLEAKGSGSPVDPAVATRLDEIEGDLRAQATRRPRFGREAIVGMRWTLETGAPVAALKARIAEQIAAAAAGASPDPMWEPEALAVTGEAVVARHKRWHERLWREVGPIVGDHLDEFRHLPEVPLTGRAAIRDGWRAVIDADAEVMAHNGAARVRVEERAVERAHAAEADRLAERARVRAELASEQEAEAARLGADARDLAWLLVDVSQDEATERTGLRPGSGVGPSDPRPSGRYLAGSGQLLAQRFGLSGSRWSWRIEWHGDVANLDGRAPADGGRKRTFEAWSVVRGAWRMVARQCRDDTATAVRVATPAGWWEGNLDEHGQPWLESAWRGGTWDGVPWSDPTAFLRAAGILRSAASDAAIASNVTVATAAGPANLDMLKARFGKRLFYLSEPRSPALYPGKETDHEPRKPHPAHPEHHHPRRYHRPAALWWRRPRQQIHCPRRDPRCRRAPRHGRVGWPGRAAGVRRRQPVHRLQPGP